MTVHSEMLETENKPRYARPRHKDAFDGFGVRVYRSTPENITLQLRTGIGYASVWLTREEAHKIGARLIAEAADRPLEAHNDCA